MLFFINRLYWSLRFIFPGRMMNHDILKSNSFHEIIIDFFFAIMMSASLHIINAESGKVPRMLAAFPRSMARKILSKKIVS
jgi:hypothetical protein